MPAVKILPKPPPKPISDPPKATPSIESPIALTLVTKPELAHTNSKVVNVPELKPNGLSPNELKVSIYFYIYYCNSSFVMEVRQGCVMFCDSVLLVESTTPIEVYHTRGL